MPSGKDIRTPVLIGVDWGTSAFRAYLMDPEGRVLDQVSHKRGILSVCDGDFESVLTDACGDWLTARPGIKVLMCGMIGSRGGWHEAHYVTGAVGVTELAARLTRVPGTGHDIQIVPGLAGRDFSGGPDVMRGEETMLVGALAADAPRSACYCLPGTHSKWVNLVEGRICGFSTYLTGEMFALLRERSILTPLMTHDEPDWCAVSEAAFLAGLDMAAEPSGLLHQLFSLRAGVLMQEADSTALAAKLSGLLIGAELAVLDNATPYQVVLVATAPVKDRYALALRHKGFEPIVLEAEECCRRGLLEIAAAADALVLEHAG